MLDVIKHVADDSYVFRQRQHPGALCCQRSPTAAVRNSRLSFSWAVAHPTAQNRTPLIASIIEWYSSISTNCESTRLKKSSCN